MLIAFQVLGGLAILFIGGEMLVKGASSLARALGIPSFVIGLTVVAYGTSSPELVISIEAVLKDHADIALGNVIGSNISNILCVMGLSALIYPIALDKQLGRSESIVVFISTGILALILLFLDDIARLAGVLFIVLLSAYTWFIFSQAKKTKSPLPKEQAEEVESHISVRLNGWQASVVCIVGALLLVFGANLLVNGTVELSRMFGISEAAIGVTLVAFGGSVPELVTSVIAAFHRKSEIVLGNILGSNLFNILGILGITSLVKPIAISEKFASLDVWVLLVVTLMLVLTVFWRNAIGRVLGASWFTMYALYVYVQFT
jgi:cation:H+ antiporter